MSLSITITSEPQGASVRSVVLVEGEVDELRSQLSQRLEAGDAEIVVDLATVPYIDSTGIGVLVGAAHRAADQGTRLSVARPQRNVARVLGLLGVTDELNISDETR